MANLKLRYDAETGKAGQAYPEHLVVPEPYLVITTEQNNEISLAQDKIFFVENGELVPKNKLEVEQKEWFSQHYFKTSIGFIKFKPTLQNGDTLDFIALLPQYRNLAMAVGALQAGAFIYYDEPDFTQELTPEYLENLQHTSPQMTLAQYNSFELEATTAYQKAFFGWR